MDSSTIDYGSIIVKSEYFQSCLESLLGLLQPSFYCLDLIVKVLVHGPDGSGKRLLAKTVAEKLNMKFLDERVGDMLDENIVGTEKKVRAAISKASSSAPCLIYLTGYELFCKLEDSDLDRIEHCIKETLETLTSETSQPVAFIGSTSNFDKVYRTPLSHIFQDDIQLHSPTLKQAREILSLIECEAELQSKPSDLLNLCKNGEFYLGNLLDLVGHAEINAHECIEEKNYPKEKNGTHWSHIGGLNHVKAEIIDTIQLSLDFPQLKKSGLRRTGVLLYGSPGTGKTLLAKAVATECSLNFINVKGPELLNEYVGQSEDNIRKVFQKARETSPSVIFFDELDSLAPNRGQTGDSGGVMDRMVSQILAEMDGIGKSDAVFVIGATNRVDLVDSSLLRPGRFDKVLEVPLPATRDSRIQILQALTRKMKLSHDVDLDSIERMARPNMSGADLQGLCSRASQRTFDRCIGLVESGQVDENDVEIVTTMEDFLSSFEE